MTVIPISDEQARLIGEAIAPIVLVDSRGREVAKVAPTEPTLAPDASEEEVIAEIYRRMAADDGTRYTHAEAMARLRELAPE